jgi:outer membrane lipoprotein SlyB
MKKQLGALMVVALVGSISAYGQDSRPCQGDIQKYCSRSSGDRPTFECLLDHQNDVTDACYDDLKRQMSEQRSSRREPICPDCGKVVSVDVHEKKGEGGALGIVGGGIAGALLGHQVGGGRGQDLATIAGAAGGAYAGNKIEQKMTSSKSWSVRVRMENGDERVFTFDKDPGFAAGDPVRLSGGSIVPR